MKSAIENQNILQPLFALQDLSYRDFHSRLTEKRLPVWIHNKTIQKAVESYRITPEQKSYLKTLRRHKTGECQ